MSLGSMTNAFAGFGEAVVAVAAVAVTTDSVVEQAGNLKQAIRESEAKSSDEKSKALR
jgi:hypothetical protein